ncbi:MAG: ATP-binding protein [Thermoanaerobaculia bacterium]|nr:ATP-binding protein [Thermoanaerobaculia bacterium]
MTRRILWASLLLGVFILFDLALLGWLSFRSLSQREIERVLLETREEAEDVADEIAGGAAASGEDLYTLIAVEQEKQTYLDAILKKRDVVRNIEIRDSEGRLVFRAATESFSPPRNPELPEIVAGELEPRVEEKTVTSEESFPYDMEVPIGEFGFLHVGISPEELESRVAVLRGELVDQTLLIGAVTVVVLILAYLTIAALWKRGRRLEQKAIEAERMAYIGTLASGLAHEIRNPLNSLNLNIQLLEEESGGRLAGSSSGRLLAITRDEIGRLERLVTDFLLYAKPRPIEPEPTSCRELLERCRDLLAGEFESRGVRLQVDDRAPGARVEVDREQITQLLVNLAQNALAAVEGVAHPRVVLRAVRGGGRIALEVEDNGGGISAADRERIFDLFYSTRKGGTGLGLAVVRRIAQVHGGRIEVLAGRSGGTRMRLELDEVRAPGATAETRDAAAGAVSPTRPRRPASRTALP